MDGRIGQQMGSGGFDDGQGMMVAELGVMKCETGVWDMMKIKSDRYWF